MESYERFFLGLTESQDAFDVNCKAFNLSALFYKHFDSDEHLKTVYVIKALLHAFDQQALSFENKDHFFNKITSIYQQNTNL